MKVIPLSEAKAKLSRYGQLCHDEPVVITVNGKPFFQLVPLSENDDLIDRLIEQHPGFRHLLEQRLGERSLSSAAAERQLAATGSRPLTRAGNKRRPRRTRSQ
jgi:prevent-host-death family protein